jgi:creatinine amidohydrolase
MKSRLASPQTLIVPTYDTPYQERSPFTMQITDMNWMQVEEYLQRDDRALLPLGSTEQHAFLSLSTDSLLSEKLASDAAEPLQIPVFPVLAYGITPYFGAYPGTLSLRVETYARIVHDLLTSLRTTGFRRILIVNGHGGNTSAGLVATEFSAAHPEMKIKFHSWWNAPKTWAAVNRIDPQASHASWMENFLWTRLPGVTMPAIQKTAIPDDGPLRAGAAARAAWGDGNFSGYYQRSDEEMAAIWAEAVQETRTLLTENW